MEEKYIVVIGGCSLDETYLQHVDGTYSNVPDIVVPGGKASNQAVSASLAGAKVKIITILGSKESEATQEIVDNLVKKGVDVSCIEFNENVNNDVSKIRIGFASHDNEIERISGAIDSFYSGLIYKHEDLIKGASFVIAQMKAPKEFSIELINFCHENNVPISITPCRPDKLLVRELENVDLINKMTFITANQNECQVMFDNLPVVECVSMFPNKLIVTLGENGLMYHNGNSIIHVSSVHVQNVVDTTGAGDTLAGNFVAGLVSGLSVNDSLIRGTYASALAIQEKTAQKGMPTKAKLDKYIAKHEANNRLY